MAHITKLPDGLRYFELNGQRILDIRNTHVDAIPRRLRGVDSVLTRSHQLNYIAPDYKGIVEFEDWRVGHRSAAFPPSPLMQMSQVGMDIAKYGFKYKEDVTPGIFDQFCSVKKIYSVSHDEEMRLPSNLRFSWSTKRKEGRLDATATWLTKQPKISGVNVVMMPTVEELLDRYAKEKEAHRKLKKKSERADYGYIRHMTGEWRR